MKNLILMFFWLTLIGCANENKVFRPDTYERVSSTCGDPSTNLTIVQSSFIDNSPVKFKLTQYSQYENCNFTVDGEFITNGNSLILTYISGRVFNGGNCNYTELVFDHSYTYTLVDKTLTLSSIRCTNVYVKP